MAHICLPHYKICPYCWESFKICATGRPLAGTCRNLEKLPRSHVADAYLVYDAPSFGFATRGLVYAGSDDDELTNEPCVREGNFPIDDFRTHLRCIDVGAYFGSILSTCLTMVQLITLDRWAAHVVRPLSGMRPEACVFMVCFVTVATYGLLNICIGAIVNLTVELAKLHDTHRDRISVVLDTERVRVLRDYFERCLLLENKTLLDFREIKEAHAVPQVRRVFDELSLPVNDLHQLWDHLDTHCEEEITLDQFEHGCAHLLQPAKRMDMACLSARLNGRAEFTEELGQRADVTVKKMSRLFRQLSIGFSVLRTHVNKDEISEIFPEVGLRRAGKMVIPEPSNDD